MKVRSCVVAVAIAILAATFGGVGNASAITIRDYGSTNFGGYCPAKYPFGWKSYYTGGGGYTTLYYYAAKAVLKQNHARGWKCEQAYSSVSTGINVPTVSYAYMDIDVNDVCRWQSGNSRAYASLTRNDAYGWRCYASSGGGY